MLPALLALFIWTSSAVKEHPFYFSKTTIAYSKEDRAYQLSISLFTDEIEKALELQGKPALKLNSPRQHPRSAEWISAYIRKHLVIEIDGKVLPLTWVGMEKGEEPQVLWCYLECPADGLFQKLRISNDLLLEVTEAQKNLVTFTPADNESRHLLFMKDNTVKSITP